jgi:hypothetical protein
LEAPLVRLSTNGGTVQRFLETPAERLERRIVGLANHHLEARSADALAMPVP